MNFSGAARHQHIQGRSLRSEAVCRILTPTALEWPARASNDPKWGIGLAANKKLNARELTEQHFARIHRAALVLTGNPWDADDLTQETFLVVARQWRKFQQRSSPYTWIYGIMLNLERRQRRRHGRHRTKLQLLREQEPKQSQTVPAAETSIEVSEWKRSLWSQVAELADPQRQALVLRFSEHLSYQEIAEAMECPLGTVKSRIFHGLATLRELISGDQEAHQVPQHPDEDLTNVV